MSMLGLLLYRTMVYPIMYLSALVLSLLPLKNSSVEKIRTGLKQRRTPRNYPEIKDDDEVFWVHAASGEFEYAKPVIAEIKRLKPRSRIVVTYFSPSYRERIEKDPNVFWSSPLPLDFPGAMSDFIRRIKPKKLLIARTDVWPEMLWQCRKRGIPTHLFAVTQRPINGISAWAKKQTLQFLTGISCVSQEDHKNLTRLDLSLKIEIDGDPRFDQVFARLAKPKELPQILTKDPTIPTLICGSSWLEDERTLISAIKSGGPGRFRIIITPHEPTDAHLSETEKLLSQSGFTSTRLSQTQTWSSTEVMIVDQVGILAELYQISDVALIGGSFRGSVHSVMEALGTGNVCIVGPFHHNNREAVAFSTQPLNDGLFCVNVAPSAQELAEILNRVVSESEKLSQWRQTILHRARALQGASSRIAQRLLFDS